MTGVTFKGRLGNQLFQFCFYHYLRSNNPGKWVFLVNPHHAVIGRYFDLEGYDRILNSKPGSLILWSIPRLLKFRDIHHQNFVSPRPVSIAPRTVHHGYFQTDWYIRNAGSKPSIRVKKEYADRFRQQYGTLFDKHRTIAVHIRRTDYLTYGKRDISIPVDFFKTQLRSIADLDLYKVIFLSDDMNFVRKHFPARENFVFSGNDEITDFQIIQHADIAIISNSSFSWWAAYLSEKDNRVIAPKNWFGFGIGREHPRGIMTSRFDWRDVR